MPSHLRVPLHLRVPHHMREQEPTQRFVPTIVKYAFALVLALIAFWRTLDGAALFLTLAEILLTFALCNVLCRRSRVLASIASAILLLFIDVQQLLLIFANTYLTLVMLTNVDSLEDLSGKMVVYIAAALIMLAIVCLPIRAIDLKHFRLGGKLRTSTLAVAALVAAEAAGIAFWGVGKSPLGAYSTIAAEHVESIQLEQELKRQPNATLEFYREAVADHVSKPSKLPEQPNIVLIFTEGLSQNIIDDTRNIMPNVREYQQESLSFTSYYNHTFATYRGLIGQLFSGYQHNNLDPNTLVSLPQILGAEGYRTAFINVEPGNGDFYEYLNSLGFQTVCNYPDEKHYGPVKGHLSDKEAYTKLLKEMKAYAKKPEPFFISIYTVGTHASFDSVNEKFGYGYDSELNKFYDADFQFGTFMEKFVKSSLHDNTIVVYTSDHCSYADMYYSSSFYNYARPSVEVDVMPLFIYYKGVKAQQVDAEGRNSLDMAPTLLDFLDVTAPNYFLGNSLFAPADEAAEAETFFSSGSIAKVSTKGATIGEVPATKRKQINKLLRQYFAAKHQEPLTPADVESDEDDQRLADEVMPRTIPTDNTIEFERLDEEETYGPEAPADDE